MAIKPISCSKCGATIDYDSDKRLWKCSFCGAIYKEEHTVHNTIINNTTQIIRQDSECVADEMVSNAERLLSLKQYPFAKEVIQELVCRFPDDYRTWILLIRLELSQFEQKVYCDVDECQTVRPKRASKKMQSALLADREAIESDRFNKADFEDDLCSARHVDKKRGQALDMAVINAAKSLLNCSTDIEIGEFLIVEECCENGLTGISYCYLGDSRIIALPNLYNRNRIKINRVYVFSDIEKYKIIVPKETEMIENGAFGNCSRLEEIEIKSEEISISENSFFGCSALKCIKLFARLKSIQDNAFSGCDGLRRLVLGGNDKLDARSLGIINSLTSSPERYGGSSVLVVQLEDVSYIPESMFCANKRITKVFVKNSESVWVSLKDFVVVLSDNTRCIGRLAFSQCDNLQGVDIVADELKIDDYSFSDNRNLSDIRIKANRLEIEEFAFCGAEDKCNVEILTDKNKTTISKKLQKRMHAKIRLF